MSDGQPVHGANETYLENGRSLPQDMQDNVRKAMKFKERLDKLNGNDDAEKSAAFIRIL